MKKKQYVLIYLYKIDRARYAANIAPVGSFQSQIIYFEASRDETVSILRKKMSCSCPHWAYRRKG